MGRPKLDLDKEQIYQLSLIHCTNEEIAKVMGCSVDTITNRFSDVLEKGKSEGKSALRRQLWKMAMNGNLGACIWLSKQHLGMTDKIDQKHEIDERIIQEVERLKALPKPKLIELINEETKEEDGQ